MAAIYFICGLGGFACGFLITDWIISERKRK